MVISGPTVLEASSILAASTRYQSLLVGFQGETPKKPKDLYDDEFTDFVDLVAPLSENR